VDRAQLADFLRTRREALQPEDVGLPRGRRRRTSGLRREEVAALCGMSSDYYSRIEQQRGPNPSEQMLTAIARGLHLSPDERDHLFRLAGHAVPQRTSRSDQVSSAMMRILDRLGHTCPGDEPPRRDAEADAARGRSDRKGIPRGRGSPPATRSTLSPARTAPRRNDEKGAR